MPELPAMDARCFVIAPIGPPDSEVRKRTEQTLRHVIGPAAEAAGLKALAAHQINESGLITLQIIENLRDAPMLVADLTDSNPNVYYELALRHALCRPYVQIKAAGQDLPFDVKDTRTLDLDLADLDAVEECRDALAETIRSGLSSARVESPISRVLELGELRASPDPDKQHTAQVLEALSQLSAEVSGMRGSSSGPPPEPGGFSYQWWRSAYQERRKAASAIEGDLHMLLLEEAELEDRLRRTEADRSRAVSNLAFEGAEEALQKAQREGRDVRAQLEILRLRRDRLVREREAVLPPASQSPEPSDKEKP